ncbi:MAG: hypothetical protein ACE15B_09890 [Bryobacteraceae bacterium]
MKRGDVLGYVGNSGLSNGPHLLFGVNDGPLLLGSEGVPYVFDAFEARRGPEAPRTKHWIELPLRDWLVFFPE